MNPQTERNFWLRVDTKGGPNACHPWSGSMSSTGAPKLYVPSGSGSALRIAWELSHGVVPSEMMVCRTCSTRECVNFRHLTLKPRGREATFWAAVKKTDGCWEWTGYRRKSKQLYGSIMVNAKHMYAHRYSWLLHNGPIPDDMIVCHRCDNPSCVRPDHLFLGTDADNVADMVAKGRNSRGEKHAAIMRAVRLRNAC